MRRRILAGLGLAVALVASRAATSEGALDAYLPLRAAPEFHRALLENDAVLVLDVSIPAGATVPAHLHPWPAVFITVQPAHLIFRNLEGKILRDVPAPATAVEQPLVVWRKPGTEPATVTNVDSRAQRAIRVELKLLGS